MDKMIEAISKGGTGEYDARQERGEAVAQVKAYEDVDGDTQYAIHWLGKRLPHGTKLYAHPTPDAGRVADDAELERIIDASAGEWHDDEFRITGSDLMHMLRAVSRLRGDAGRVAELEAQLAASDRHGVYLEELTDAQVDRIAALEAQLAETKKAYRSMVDANRAASERLAESREREGKMREALEDMRYELHQYTEGFDVIWGRVDEALAADKEGE